MISSFAFDSYLYFKIRYFTFILCQGSAEWQKVELRFDTCGQMKGAKKWGWQTKTQIVPREGPLWIKTKSIISRSHVAPRLLHAEYGK